VTPSSCSDGLARGSGWPLVTLGTKALAATLLATFSARAAADEPAFGPNDIQTVFFFNKSDDHNRVDYGLKLDGKCVPVGDEALFPYWRELENPPPVKTHTLKFIEYAAYGVSEQKVLKRPGQTEIAIKLRALSRPITVVTEKDATGKCRAVAHAKIGEVADAELSSAYIKLSHGWSVEYVEVHGRDPKSGKDLTEKLLP
jgi:hypothetical protein